MDSETRKVLDTPVVIGPGLVKTEGDCTVEELKAAAEYATVQAARHQAEADRIAAGQPPACDFHEPDGTWCENDAVVIGTGPPHHHTGPLALCSEHWSPT